MQDRITGLAKIIDTNPAKRDFASSLLASLVKGKATDKQVAWIDRLIEEANRPASPAANLTGLLEAFRVAAQGVKFPKIALKVGDTEWVVSYVRPDSDKAKPENRDTVAVAAGKYGDPDGKWGGRIAKSGDWTPGKDSTPELVEALAALSDNPAGIEWKKRGK